MCSMYFLLHMYFACIADWTLRNDTTNMITVANSSVEYSNDTVTVHSDLTIEKLRANSLNGTVFNQLIDNLFIINDRQEIKG